MAVTDFTFDGPNKLIKINVSSSIDIQDMYSRWKDWVLTNDNSKFIQGMRSVGGDPITDTKSLGRTFFLINGWRMEPTASDHTLDVDGNIYAEDIVSGSTTTVDPIVQPSGNYKILVRFNVSNLVDAEVLQSSVEQSLEYVGQVYIDTVNGIAGSSYPVGTPAQPSNNLSDAITIANTYGFKNIVLLNDIVLDQDVKGFSLRGATKDVDVTLQSGNNYDNSSFEDVILTGNSSGSINISDSVVNGVNGLSGIISKSGLTDSLSCQGSFGELVTFHDCYSTVPGNASPIINVMGSACGINMRSYSGGLTIVSSSNSQFISTIELLAGRVIVDNSNTAGFVSIRGVGHLNDTSAMGFVIDQSAFVNASTLMSSVTSSNQYVDEIHSLHALKPAESLYVSRTKRNVGPISQSISSGGGTGSGAYTVVTRI